MKCQHRNQLGESRRKSTLTTDREGERGGDGRVNERWREGYGEEDSSNWGGGVKLRKGEKGDKEAVKLRRVKEEQDRRSRPLTSEQGRKV